MATKLPIRVLISFLTGATEKDARLLARTQAEKLPSGGDMCFYGITAYQDGYILEIHEGGSGDAYVPAILARWKQAEVEELPRPFVRIATSTRTVVVAPAHQGLEGLTMPESDSEDFGTIELEPSGKLKPAIMSMKPFFASGMAMFAVGFLILAGGLATRIKTWEPPAPSKVESYVTDDLPLTQWNLLMSKYAREAEPVLALRYNKGKWVVETEKATPNGSLPPAPPVATGAAPVQTVPQKVGGK